MKEKNLTIQNIIESEKESLKDYLLSYIDKETLLAHASDKMRALLKKIDIQNIYDILERSLIDTYETSGYYSLYGYEICIPVGEIEIDPETLKLVDDPDEDIYISSHEYGYYALGAIGFDFDRKTIIKELRELLYNKNNWTI